MKQLVVIRHAIAEERDTAQREGRADTARALTDEGRAKMAKAAAGLRRCHPALDLVATSPLRRAMETAEIVAAAYAPLTVAECEALVPQAHPEELLDWLRGQQGDSVAVVGHEPDLGIWTSWALAGDTIPLLYFKKGGACLLEFPAGKWRPGEASLMAADPGATRGLGDVTV